MRTDLPKVEHQGHCSLEEAISSRRTRREFARGPVSLQDVSRLLWAGQGKTGKAGMRAAPSAGALYSLELYVVAGAVSNLPTGLYRYSGTSHSLESLSGVDIRDRLAMASLGEQPWVRDAAVLVIVAADFELAIDHFRTQAPVGKRGKRYVYIEAGAVAENIHLSATALGLGFVLVAGFDDEQMKLATGCHGNVQPVALLCIGAA